MPFVQRVVSPVHLSRAKLHNDRGRPIIDDQELEAISNHTLCFALKQLASVLKVATEVFQQLNGELDQVKDKSSSLKGRIAKLQVAVDSYDPKNVTVPVGDMTWFSELRSHYKAKQDASGELFTAASRPLAVDVLYRRAAQVAAAQGKAPSSPTPSLTVTPVLGRTRRRHARFPQVDIETRKPASLAGVRKWTSSEALGELTSDPDATLRINPTPDAVDHTLPSPEEQLNAIANKFPSEMIYVDVSGKSFDRMSCMRRSLVLRQPPARKRRTRRQRRNTIATTDPKEIHQAASESTETVVGKSWAEMAEKKSQLEALKEWGLGRLRSLRPINKPIRIIDTKTAVTMRLAAGRKLATEPHSSSGNWSASSESGHSTTTTHHPRSSISSGSTCLKQRRPVTASTSSSVTSESSTVTPENDFETGSMYSCDTEGYYTSFHLDSGLKPLREEEPIAALSSTSILSGSTLSQGLTAESEYELFGRGSTSTTASSAGTVCTALPAPPPRRDSHLSGNRTFPERSRPLKAAQTHSLRPADFAHSDHVDHLTRENLYKHNDDRCTISADIHRERPEKCGDSPDSGHNTCSSPVDSVASPSLDVVSECSDLEGVDRVERIREKTTINSSRIPSMCVITPPQSDDETSFKLDLSIDSGEYVTIAQVQQNIPEIRPSEFVSLNALPNESSLERRRHGARVTLDSEGKVIYASDSLRRKKSVHTTGTFEPGPCVVNNNSPIMPRVANIRPIQIRSPINVQKNTVQTKTLNTDNRQALLKKETNIQNDIGRNIVPHSPVKISNEKQYFPKSAYERENPCKSVRPLSPLAKQPNPSIKSPVMAPKTVVKAGSPTRSLSPIVSRGAYVRIQQPSDDLSFNSVPTGVIEPTPHAAVKRSDSYRLANQDAVFNPNSLGRRQYGPAVIASPTLLTALHEAQTIPAAPKEDVERTPTKLLQTAIDSPTSTTPVLQKHVDGLKSSANVMQTNLNSPCSPSKVLHTHFDNLRLSTNSVQTNIDGPRTPTKVLQTHFDGLRSTTNVVHSNLDSPRTPTSTAQMSFDFAKASGKIPPRGFSSPSSPSGISNQGTSTPKTLNFASPVKTTSSPLTSTPTKNIMSPLDFSTIPSPIEKSPPKNGRSAMDLFAIIHDSKKRIQALQQKGSQITWPKSIPAKTKVDNKVPPQNYNSLKQPSKTVENKEPIQNGIMKHMPKPMSPLTDLNTQKYTRHNNSYNSLPRMKIQNYEESPKNLVQRKVYGRQSQASGNSKGGPTSTKDFKRLLLQTGTGTTGFVKESAVDRLKNRNLMSHPIQHDVLSTTIPEDCEGDEEVKNPVMMSASLVNKQIKAFEARASPTLETSL